MDSESAREESVRDEERGVQENGRAPESGNVMPVSPEAEASSGGTTPVEEATGSPVHAETSTEEPQAAEEAPPAARRWDPLWVVGLLLVIVLAALVALNRIQAAKNSKSNTTAPLTVPTQAPPSTPVVKGGAVAALVNGHSIPTSDYRAILTATLRSNAAQGQQSNTRATAGQVMNQMIVNELIREYAVTHHITVSASVLNKQMQQVKQQQGGAKGFSRWLASLGLTSSQLRSVYLSDFLGQKVLQQVAPPKPLLFANVRHILITLHPAGKAARKDGAAKTLATRLLDQLQHGASFAALAKKYSDDTTSGAHGGNLGKIYAGDPDLASLPTFIKAIFSLPPNHPAMVHSQLGYQVVEVLGRGKAVPPAQNRARQAQQGKDFQTWINQQKKQASIKQLVTVTG